MPEVLDEYIIVMLSEAKLLAGWRCDPSRRSR
jgi:hypothetical protein